MVLRGWIARHGRWPAASEGSASPADSGTGLALLDELRPTASTLAHGRLGVRLHGSRTAATVQAYVSANALQVAGDHRWPRQLRCFRVTTTGTSVCSSGARTLRPRVHGIGEILDSGAYGDLDSDTVRTMLSELRSIAEGPVAQGLPRPTATRRLSTRIPTPFTCPNRSKPPTGPGSVRAGTKSASARNSAAPRTASSGLGIDGNATRRQPPGQPVRKRSLVRRNLLAHSATGPRR